MFELYTASYDVSKDGVKVAVLTFTKSAYRLGETVLGVVELNERNSRARVLKVRSVANSSMSRLCMHSNLAPVPFHSFSNIAYYSFLRCSKRTNLYPAQSRARPVRHTCAAYTRSSIPHSCHRLSGLRSYWIYPQMRARRFKLTSAIRSRGHLQSPVGWNGK